MQEDPLQDRSASVNERLTTARELLYRRRYRDSLDLINSVVLVSPSDPRAFLVRAAAFEGMDLLPQADADIERARALCEQQGLDFHVLVDELNQPPPKPTKGQRAPPPPRRKSSGAGAGEMAIIVAFIIFLAIAVGVGTYMVIGSLDLNDDGPSNGGSVTGNPTAAPSAATETGTVTSTPLPATPTRTPAPSLPPGVDGDPYSLSSVEAAGEAQGMTVGGGSAASGFSGFSIAPTSVTVSGSGTSADTAVFIYDDAAAPAEDWTLVIGERPAAKPGRTVPPHFTIYWNTNVVVVVLDDPGALGAPLLDGILNMAP